MTTANDSPLRRADVVDHVLDGEALLFDPVTLNAHQVNESGLFVWECCDGHMTVTDIATRLTERYDVTHGDALQHVSRLIGNFSRVGLIAESAEPHDDVTTKLSSTQTCQVSASRG